MAAPWPSFSWSLLLRYVLYIAGAYVIALPVAWERERDTRILGLRTFPLVSVAACAYVLIATAVFGLAGDAQSRLLQGVITGIGFLGGGVILKAGTSIHGTATAASVWAVGAAGVAIGYGLWELAIVISLVNFVTLRFLTPLSKRQHIPPDGGHGDDAAL